MNEIITEEQYNEAVKLFEQAYENANVSLEEKIHLCEEFAYSEYVKGSGRIDYSLQLTELYLEAGLYQKVINFVLFEFKTHLSNEDDWWQFVAAVAPGYMSNVITACIELKDYEQAKGYAEALRQNREAMLKMHQDDGLTRECKFWYASVIAKLAKIAYIENDYQVAIAYLNDPLVNIYASIETAYYAGMIAKGDKLPSAKDIPLVINLFKSLADRGVKESDYNSDARCIIDATYQLGLIYATEPDYQDKESAIFYLNKAKDLGYIISDERIVELTNNIVNANTNVNSSNSQTSANKKGGCYVATCVYGSYDCPQVWTLRRYRDYSLALTWYGRLFINVYYAISPTVVRWFGNYSWFHKMLKKPLDHWVQNLNNQGIENTQYYD